MQLLLSKTAFLYNNSFVYVTSVDDFLKEKPSFLSTEEYNYAVKSQAENKEHLFHFHRLPHFAFVALFDSTAKEFQLLEKLRVLGDKLQIIANKLKQTELSIVGNKTNEKQLLAFVEGIALGNYQFIKYKTDKQKEQNSLTALHIFNDELCEESINELNILLEAVTYCRNLVNEPLSSLNSVQLAESFTEKAKETQLHVKVLHKHEIEKLGMGGLLGVNKGSVDPPTFTILEWKPKNAVNEKPVALVGKGVVFDTGGLNLKPDNYMNDMKDDMAGAATMASVMWAVAKAQMPIHVVAFCPATDNRPGGNAFVTGDILNMMDGTTVEVLNTDAEGRLILADGISYANQYNPQLIITAATLTGAAARAIGKYGIVAMHQDAENYMNELKQNGEHTYERIAEFPFWEEYGEMIKSNLADIQNIGGNAAGMITAGKFLQHFAKAPFIHLDIAGVAFLEEKYDYRTKGGTGTGIRLLFNFLKTLSQK